jgi:hypothetical protein
MSDKKNVLIKILEIKEILFNYKPFPIPIEEVQFGKNLNYGIGIQLDFQLEDDILKLKLLINYKLPEYKEAFLTLETEIVFHVKNLKSVIVKEEKKKININDDLFSTLLGVCIGTTRGILSTKTRGTSFSGYPLPIVNVKDILKQLKKTNQ